MSFRNARSLRAFGIAIPVLSTVFFWIADAHMNLFDTGVTPGFLIGAANVLLAYWVYKQKI